jgi:hypothetical protein
MKTKLMLVSFLAAAAVLGQSTTPLPNSTPATPAVKRTGKTFVQIYLQEDFKGHAIRVEVPCELNNDARLKELGIPNDSIMSMKIPDGVSVTLYAAAGFGGASQTYNGKVATLGDLKGQASSLKAEFTK